ncbi:hypothetical protein C3489_15160 [Streptomyces sp. Ru71]|uniref:hypothetical protein n=1 Tax=Streptomyces sp. Ru71 TaxID=2080746 RepID=UPI000CDDFF1A|nr:hypothetical protein [Streptomyces sp. Ru71]POX53789.1 hypothetical protein C3489_15160 [Streptomyces sp. Ru71]
MRRARLPASSVTGALVAALAALGVVGGVLVGWGGLDTVNGCGYPDNPYPSETARDWVAYADAVVVGRAVSERESGRRELALGAYRYDVERTVRLRAESVPYVSRERSHPGVGATLDYVAPGWKVTRAGGDRVDVLTGEAPRVVPGHTYVLALRWREGRWVALGEGGVVPYDGHVVGRGEWCGRVLGTDGFAQGERLGRRDDHSLEKALLGQGDQALTRALKDARR